MFRKVFRTDIFWKLTLGQPLKHSQILISQSFYLPFCSEVLNFQISCCISSSLVFPTCVLGTQLKWNLHQRYNLTLIKDFGTVSQMQFTVVVLSMGHCYWYDTFGIGNNNDIYILVLQISRLYSSRAWWPLAPTFCSWATRKYSFFNTMICWAP